MTSPMRSPRGPQLSFARTTWRCWPLSHPVTVEVDGFGPVLFCHGTPRDDEEVVLVDTRLERWQEVFAELPLRRPPWCAVIRTCRSCALSPVAWW